MKIVWLTYGIPYPPDSGARMRDFHLIREVCQNAEVDLLSIIPAGGSTEPGPFARWCGRVELFPLPEETFLQQSRRVAPLLLAGVPAACATMYLPSAAARLRTLLAENRADILQIEHSLLAAYRNDLPLGNCRTVLSLHNVGFHQYASIAKTSGTIEGSLFRLKSAALKQAERNLVQKFDRCIVVSPHERDILKRALPGVRAVVIANGVDCAALLRLPESPGKPELLFTGVMNYPPNADAAVYFVRSILPLIREQLPGVGVSIVGHVPTTEVQDLAKVPGVRVTGFVDDVLPYYREATAVVVPLRAGGGTRLKVLEAMALGRPVVSTSIGSEGIAITSGKDVMIADDPASFATSVIALLRDAEARRRLVENARRLVEELYDWRFLGTRLTQLHREVVNEAA